MLLDVVSSLAKIRVSITHSLLQVIAADDKFVITCERDEKIRVSFLPNAYNINNFCLGHTEFVSSLALVNSDLLLSGSGVSCLLPVLSFPFMVLNFQDATLKLWEYKTGKVLHTEKLRMPSDDDMQKAVRSITLFKVNAEFFIAAVVLNKYLLSNNIPAIPSLTDFVE